jgi:hypothetical protein
MWLVGALAALTVTGTFGLLAGAFARSEKRLRREALQRAAVACHLEAVETDASGAVAGRRGAQRVRVEWAGMTGSRFMRVTVEDIEPALQAVSARLHWSSDAILLTGDVEVGDPSFDADVVVVGAPPLVRGLFTADTRALAKDVFNGEARVRMGGGAIVAEFPDGGYGPRASSVSALVELARRLQPGLPADQRLAAIVSGDPLASVRVTALETLVGLAPGGDLTRTALRGAAADPAPFVRLKAALALGDEGVPVLQALAAEAGIADQYSSTAVTALGSRLASARARERLEVADSEMQVLTARALLSLLAARGPEEAAVVASFLDRRANALASVLSPTGAAMAVAAVEALAEARPPASEDALVAVLASSVPGVAQAAAQGLGRIGTARAVPALRQAEAQRGDLRRAARQAIAAIRSRLTDATPGQVSLAGGVGELSVADASDGRVSLEPDG